MLSAATSVIELSTRSELPVPCDHLSAEVDGIFLIEVDVTVFSFFKLFNAEFGLLGSYAVFGTRVTLLLLLVAEVPISLDLDFDLA